MDDLEGLKIQAIQDVLNAIKEQMKKDKISAGDMHFDKIKYIERLEDGAIRILYPLGKGTYHNYCVITVEPNGKTNIRGVQTSYGKRYGVTKTGNGSFNIDLTIENWAETESITKVTEKGYGKYVPEIGFFEDCAPTRVDTEYMWNQLTKKFPSTFELENFHYDSYTYTSEGYGLPNVPCVEYFNDGTDLLIISPKQAVILLRKLINDEKNDIYSRTILYKDVSNGLASDCFDIALDQLDIYVVENEGILDQTDEEKEKIYAEYKEAVLEAIDIGVDLSYSQIKGIVNDDLLKDPDFVSRLDEILIDLEEAGYSEYVEKIRSFLDLPKKEISQENVGESIVDMTQEDPSINLGSQKGIFGEIKDATVDKSEKDKTQD